MTEFVIFKKDDWNHFCSKLNFGSSNLDARAIKIMNEPINISSELKLYCRVCNGNGMVKNHSFEICRYKDYQEYYGIKEGDCDHCDPHLKSGCKEGEFTSCPHCNDGQLIIDLSNWSLINKGK